MASGPKGDRACPLWNVEVRQEEPITVDKLRAACKTFDVGTAVGTDGIRPRHLLHLPDESLQIPRGYPESV